MEVIASSEQNNQTKDQFLSLLAQPMVLQKLKRIREIDLEIQQILPQEIIDNLDFLSEEEQERIVKSAEWKMVKELRKEQVHLIDSISTPAIKSELTYKDPNTPSEQKVLQERMAKLKNGENENWFDTIGNAIAEGWQEGYEAGYNNQKFPS